MCKRKRSSSAEADTPRVTGAARATTGDPRASLAPRIESAFLAVRPARAWETYACEYEIVYKVSHSVSEPLWDAAVTQRKMRNPFPSPHATRRERPTTRTTERIDCAILHPPFRVVIGVASRPSRARGRWTRACRDLGLDVTRHPSGPRLGRASRRRGVSAIGRRTRTRGGRKKEIIIIVVVVVIARTVVIVNAILVVPTRSDASTSRRQGARKESVETRRMKLQNPSFTVYT